MSRLVKASPAVKGLTLPNGWVLDAGDQVTIPDEEWEVIEADEFLSSRVKDLGYSANDPDPVPSFRDIQRAVAGSDAGLEAQIDAVEANLAAHVGDTTAVHGIPDTSKLDWVQQSNITGSEADGSVLTKIAGMWVGAAPEADSDYEQTFHFVIPATLWIIDHNQNTEALSVELFDASGRRMIAETVPVSLNRIEARFYNPTTGKAVVHE